MIGRGTRNTVLALLACIIATGCGAPYGVSRASPEAVHRSLTANVLSTGGLSNFTVIMLHRRNLSERFEKNPADVLRQLHTELVAGALANDDLFSLAELSFHHAARKGGQPHFLAATIYAYAYLFPSDPSAAPSPFDARPRVAMDIYNRALNEAFIRSHAEGLQVAGGVYPLPFGEIELSFDERQLLWGERRRLARLYPAADYKIHGFENRYRQPGIGAPLAASTEKVDDAGMPPDFVGPGVHVPVTLLLRLTTPRRQLLQERLTGVLELYKMFDGATTAINGDEIPLEQEPTAALALALTDRQPWKDELRVFLGSFVAMEARPTFGGTEPHRRGRIPVIFVHGTASNYSVWANMINDLGADPMIRKHFEFWLFTYDSGQPILYSGMLLRRTLKAANTAFQAHGADPCAAQMVIIGHSQGGLLTKLTAIDSGDRFWRNVSNKPFDEVRLSAKTRSLLKEAMFIEPLPFVGRVIFIATPHAGSYLAGPGIVRTLAKRLIKLPADIAQASVDIVSTDTVGSTTGFEQLPTSIDNMWPLHPFIKAISQMPVAADIPAHSIIGLVGDDPLEQGGDGVVRYSSAHIEGVESELVVPYPHSMQSKPEVVAEVERILRHHLEATSCARGGGAGEPMFKEAENTPQESGAPAAGAE